MFEEHALSMQHTKLILLFVVFANQGYFVIINYTGSTTFGQGMIPF
jgi:hypothetical protein